jgi:hypothetical protein
MKKRESKAEREARKVREAREDRQENWERQLREINIREGFYYGKKVEMPPTQDPLTEDKKRYNED